MRQFKIFLLPAILWIIFSATPGAQAQWSSLKPTLQGGVQIVKETTTRLVLFHQSSGDSLVLTPVLEKDSDIYGAFEVKRGGNPYRVWVATEKFLNNPRFAGDAGKIFFRPTFLSALRQDEPPPEPVQKSLDPISVPDSGRAQIAKAETKAFNIAAPRTDLATSDSLLLSEPKDSLPVALEPVAPPAEATFKTTPSSRRTRRKLVEVKTSPRSEKVPPVQPTELHAATVISHALLDSLYQAALVAMNNADWQRAAFNLEKIQLLQPNYRKVVDLLAQTRVNLTLAGKPETAAEPQKSGASVFVGGAIAALGVFIALIVLPFIGVILVSPTVRVRYHLFRGHYAEAAQIYEKLLARRPNRKKLYPTLANLYLRLGRRDEAALKVYEMALQLDIAERHREEINSIVSNNYLTKGRTDARAIEVLEDALKAERLKQKKRKS